MKEAKMAGKNSKHDTTSLKLTDTCEKKITLVA
jgi:hypothetical protein